MLSKAGLFEAHLDVTDRSAGVRLSAKTRSTPRHPNVRRDWRWLVNSYSHASR